MIISSTVKMDKKVFKREILCSIRILILAIQNKKKLKIVGVFYSMFNVVPNKYALYNVDAVI